MDSLEKRNIKLTFNTALAKIQNWCAYQERSHGEVKEKLYEWNLYPSEVDQIISKLIEENFLNEERFVKAYVSGKFRIKKWGRRKIKQGLLQKKVTDKMIDSGLNTIDGDEYEATLADLAMKKFHLIKEKDAFKHKNKLITYLQSRGYETDMIFFVLKANNLYK
ncbi:regulatory protein RecX [Pedobacter flavus]|uniref:Regulatory protein RecX n=1 Tax=Pedobacter flavus TaxID=3113906 RepID=A0ABU7H245_9SPHI|nr:regulatory protein RecX [Pedobacter sp. VNH31]MEE1885387.1 regulatory protein RecX [Pedobacter sp. VNH31]